MRTSGEEAKRLFASSGTGTTPTAEPATLAMLAVGLLGLAAGHKLAMGT